jgi:hypothetical protein
MTEAASIDPGGDQSVTWVITHQVHPDRRDEFEVWISGIADAVGSFPGHEGLTILRPAGEGDSEYVLVVRFAGYDDLRRWEDSPQRAEWLIKLEPLLAGDSSYRTETGLETWFQLPGQRAMVPPPKWKMALVILLAIYPLLLVVLPLMGWIFEGILWLGVPITVSPEFFVRTLVTAVILVALMTWVAMPLLTRLFRPWLQSKS